MSEKSYDSDFDPENEGECRKTHVGREENVGKAQRAPFNINKKMRLSSIQEVPRVKSKVQHNRPSTSTVTNMSESDSDDAVSAKATQSGFNYDLSVLPEGSRTIPDNFKHVSTLHKGLTLARKRLERHAIPYFNLPSTSKDMNPSVSGLLSARKKNIPVTYNKVACNQYCNTKKMKEDKFVQISSKIMLSNNQPISDKSQKQYLENEIQIYLHKTHLLCLVAHGLYVNSVVIRSRKVFRYIYAQMPPDLKVNVSMTISHIKKMLNWFGHRYKICRDTPVSGTITKNHLESLFLGGVHKQKKYSLKDLVMLFVLLLRGMGLSARFVMSLQPVPLKPKKTNEDISDCGSKCKPETAITILEDINKPGPSGTQKLKTKMLKEKVKYENQKDNDLPVSSDSENEYEANILNGGIDYWIEVFIREEDKWISVDVYSLEIDCPREIYARCTKPAMYVVGWKNDNFLKEVTKRYVPMWHITSDVRVGKYWFEKSLRPFLIKDKRLEAYEEAQLDDCVSEINDPIPNKVTELKYHPYYTLERYLSKFECIYRNAVPLGYIKGEPVYSRDSIQEHLTPVDRMQERIKVSQQPYKILRKSMLPASEKTKKPAVIDKMIPKNDFGAIEVYDPSMLPAGTVHLQVPGIFQIAKEINIDCAPAIIGWNHHSGGSQPIIEGVVVCKENEDLLMDAWNCVSDHEAAMVFASRHKHSSSDNMSL